MAVLRVADVQLCNSQWLQSFKSQCCVPCSCHVNPAHYVSYAKGSKGRLNYNQLLGIKIRLWFEVSHSEPVLCFRYLSLLLKYPHFTTVTTTFTASAHT